MEDRYNKFTCGVNQNFRARQFPLFSRPSELSKRPFCGILRDETGHRIANDETLAAMNEPSDGLPRYPSASQAIAALGI